MQRQSRRRAALTTLGGTGATVAITIAQAFLLIPLCLTYGDPSVRGSGLVVSPGWLMAGFGIRALAIGLLTRALISISGAAVFLLSARHRAGLYLGRPSTAVWREMFALAPAMAGAYAGYLLANNSEILLVTEMFGPIPAAVCALRWIRM